MKTAFLLGLITFSAQGHPTSINPEKIVTPLLDIFSSKNKKLSETEMEVRVTTYNKDGDLSKGKGKIILTPQRFQEIKKKSLPVFQMIPNESSMDADGKLYKGTAFHIGENLILTNLHVLSHDRSNSTECRGFELHDNLTRKVFPCKKVHFCSHEHDVCLIEMSPVKVCLNFFCSKSEEMNLKDQVSLKLLPHPEMNLKARESVLTAIGNSMGLGIHYSEGRGMQLTGDNIYFFAPIRSGNSGGPLLNEKGEVIGVVKQETGEKVGENAFNVATNIETVIGLVREELANDEETLKKFDSAVLK